MKKLMIMTMMLIMSIASRGQCVSAVDSLTARVVDNLALSNGTIGCVLSTSWQIVGQYQVFAIYVNGALYKSSSSNYGLWDGNAEALEASQIGGISPGKAFTINVETYCKLSNNLDTVGVIEGVGKAMSATLNYITPATVVCSGTTTTTPVRVSGKKK